MPLDHADWSKKMAREFAPRQPTLSLTAFVEPLNYCSFFYSQDKIHNIDMTIQREQDMRKRKEKKYMTTIATKLLNRVCVCVCACMLMPYCQGRGMAIGWILERGKEAGGELHEKVKNRKKHNKIIII